eukprot:1139897-Pelagomonas_calceolata.AAC.4
MTKVLRDDKGNPKAWMASLQRRQAWRVQVIQGAHLELAPGRPAQGAAELFAQRACLVVSPNPAQACQPGMALQSHYQAPTKCCNNALLHCHDCHHFACDLHLCASELLGSTFSLSYL